ncbi:MAG: type IV pilin protein [Dokdonella sp.]
MLTASKKGFTLIELMIVVAIIAIIAAIAYPSYQKYGFRARRAEGKDLAMRVAAEEERFYTRFNSYTAAITGAPPSLGLGGVTSENLYYTASVTLQNANQTFTVRVTPTAGTAQASDSCGYLTLNNTGAKAAPTDNQSNGKCW